MSTNLVEGLADAENIRDPQDYIRRVKGLVITELLQLDSTVRVEDTNYFNHSAIPDLVMKWSGGGSRMVYLRDSYQSVAANHDTDELDRVSPFILAYSHDSSAPEPEAEAAVTISESIRRDSRTLVTEPRVLSQLRSTIGTASPLRNLVRVNFASGGRGLIDEQTGRRVVEPLDGATDVGALFAPEIAARISQARQIMALALTDTPDVVMALPLDQAHQVLVWLLTAQGIRQDRSFWRVVGEEISLEFLLKEMRESLAGADLTPLVQANADRLLPRRAYLGANVVPDGAPEPHLWSIRAGRLERRADSSTMVFSANRHLDGVDGTSSATWGQLETSLTGFLLRSVSLRGLRRDVQLETERSHDLRGDVASITSSLEDQYFVDRVIVAVAGNEDVRLTVDLDRHLVLADGGADIGSTARALGMIVAYRDPIQVPELQAGGSDELRPAGERDQRSEDPPPSVRGSVPQLREGERSDGSADTV